LALPASDPVLLDTAVQIAGLAYVTVLLATLWYLWFELLAAYAFKRGVPFSQASPFLELGILVY
jgi:hypothetical protein